ncbi:MAG: ExeA family protein [Planctomycetaceae bacterium]
MYESFWGLAHPPFTDHANPAWFFSGHSHHASLLKLRYLIDSRQGAGMLVGPSGIGKTLMTYVLEAELQERDQPVVRVLSPQFSPRELIHDIAFQLSVPELNVDADEVGLDRLLHGLRETLLELTAKNTPPLIIFEDAHLIEDRQVMHAIRGLLNLRVVGQVELTLLLVGTPVLLTQIMRIAELEDRMAIKTMIKPLSEGDTADYIRHRLTVAGGEQQIFNDDACTAIAELTGGLPRKINRLCDLALLVGYADGLTEISGNDVESVADELIASVAD